MYNFITLQNYNFISCNNLSTDYKYNKQFGSQTVNWRMTNPTFRPLRKVRESAPSFIVKPRKQFTDEGATAKFKASFDGEPPPTLKWELNAREISDGGRFAVSEKSIYFLFLAWFIDM